MTDDLTLHTCAPRRQHKWTKEYASGAKLDYMVMQGKCWDFNMLSGKCLKRNCL